MYVIQEIPRLFLDSKYTKFLSPTTPEPKSIFRIFGMRRKYICDSKNTAVWKSEKNGTITEFVGDGPLLSRIHYFPGTAGE